MYDYIHIQSSRSICKLLRKGQSCDRTHTTELPAVTDDHQLLGPCPLVSDWWAKLDLPSERPGVWSWGIENILPEWWLSQELETQGTLPPNQALCCRKRARGGMPQMSSMHQAGSRLRFGGNMLNEIQTPTMLCGSIMGRFPNCGRKSSTESCGVQQNKKAKLAWHIWS